MGVAYSIEVHPPRAVLGEPVVAVLKCSANTSSPGVLTFDHRSLVLELIQAGAPEPYLTFPNRYAIEDGGKLIRYSGGGGIEDLEAGAVRTRDFDLAVLFPEAVLERGTFAVTFRLEEANPPVRPEPVTVEVRSGPEAVSYLMGDLNSESLGVRARAAELLERMTAREFGYRAESREEERRRAMERWRAWWESEGSRLPWDSEAGGVEYPGRST